MLNRIPTSLLALSLALCSFNSVQSQTTYYSGFDNASEQAGWKEYIKGKFGFFARWTYQDGGISSPKMLIYTVPIGIADKDTIKDWYVSPKFDFSLGGSIDSFKYNYFSFMNVHLKEQFVGVYLLTGSKDSDSASSKILLMDLTPFYSGDNKWKDTGSISIPSTAGDAYIAFKLQAIDGWSSISFDNLYVTQKKTSGIRNTQLPQMELFPNPCSSHITIQYPNTFDVYMYNLQGQLVCTKQNNFEKLSFDVNAFSPGSYYLKVLDPQGNQETQSFIIEEEMHQ